MCDYVILGVPEEAVKELSSALPRRYHIEHGPVAAAAGRIPPTHAVVYLVTGGCSCSIYTGPEPDDREDREAKRIAARLKRYHKLGWSEAKIKRALLDSAHDRHRAPGRCSTDAVATIETLLSAVAARHRSGLYVLVHQYHGRLAEETFPITQRRLPAEELHLSSPTLPRDVLTWFLPSNREYARPDDA